MTRAARRALDTALRATAHEDEPRSIEEMRADFAALMARFPVPGGVRRSAVELGGRPAVLVEPEGEAGPGTILYFHGGSWLLGSPDTAMALTTELVLRTGVRAVSLDYRLAPEHPFPAAIEDGVAAFRDLVDQGEDPATIAFAGDSAGGGLSVTTSIAARDAGLPTPAAIVAFSPGLDHTRTGASMTTKDGVDPFLTAAGMRRTGALYLAGQDPYQPLLAPAVVGDLTGLPPMLLQVGTNEVLLDDAVRLATRAVEAEVDVVLDVTADVPHVFQTFVGTLDESDRALDRAALFLTQHLARG
ncbi:alpha/beta hydrolase [Curtobacterium sp. MCBD17_019]|uniref:alpha/beta hydrolase n=1 Tax=Curtobacterium sp. MCBD17_019 TaxID=2175669 RepID=UPI000DA89195|nr:alpha/beta hydrolase [Curtobacterium sp. MCBD17_019]PZE78575.1 alpha/beta hydrolase [Curtobacterium sp. MCBD17_019]